MHPPIPPTPEHHALMLAALPAVFAQVWDFPLFPPRASTAAHSVDMLYFALLAFATFFTVLVAGLIVFFVVKYRVGSAANRANPITRTLYYVVVWITIPMLIALPLFGWAAKGYFDLYHPPADARTIYVVGKQWMWKVQYPEGPREINTLHVPVGEPVKLVMTSQDVIHSFYIPAFRVKQDVLPDRYTELWFTATTPGEYHLFCAEYCGLDHSAMIGRVIALSPSDYAEWLSTGIPVDGQAITVTPGEPAAPLAVQGAGPFFQLGCNACHQPASSALAPRLDGIFGREVRLRNEETVIADEQYIRESILYPNARIVAGYPAPSLMPTYKGQVSEQQLQELVEFIKSLRDGWPEELQQP